MQLRDALLAPYDILITDQYGIDTVKRHMQDFDSTKCRLRLLDAWGTPPEQNHDKLHLRQYLVLNRNPWNEWIGMPINISGDPVEPPERKNQVVLWGKSVRPCFKNCVEM